MYMYARYLHKVFTHMYTTPFVYNFRINFLIYSHKTALEERQGRHFMLFLLMKRQRQQEIKKAGKLVTGNWR